MFCETHVQDPSNTGIVSMFMLTVLFMLNLGGFCLYFFADGAFLVCRVFSFVREAASTSFI